MNTYRELFKYYETLCKDNKIEISSFKFLFTEILSQYNLNYFKNIEDKPSEIITKKLEAAFNELRKGIPVQYILGYAYFYNLKYKVNHNVLIPRFDTEILVELVLFDNQDQSKKIVDVGTGSGCIAVALKKENELFEIIAIDNSSDALELAKFNAQENDVKIDFVNSNLLDNLIENNIKVDIIVANLPYIDKNDPEINDIVLNNEPASALFSEENGLQHIRRLIESASSVLNSGGLIYLEIGHKQAEAVKAITKKLIKEDHEIKVYKDMSSKDRVIKIKYLKD